MPRTRDPSHAPHPTTRSRVAKPKPVGATLVKNKVSKPKKSVKKPLPVVTKSISKPARRTAAKKTEAPDTVPVPVTVAPVSAPVLKSNLQLALLSPFRFPLDSARMAAQVARLSGVTFVVVGALLTLLNLDIVSGGQWSETISRQNASTIETTISNTGSSTDTVPSGTHTLDTQPPVTMNLPADSILRSEVPIYISVPYATAVVIVAYNSEGIARWSAGAEKLGDLNWKVLWDTTKVDDGTYTLRAKIKNEFGQYEYTHQQRYVIDNFETAVNNYDSNQTSDGSSSSSGTGSGGTTITASTTNTGDTSTVEETDVEEVVVEPTATVTTPAQLSLVGTQPVTSVARFLIVSPDTERVKLTARHQIENKIFDIGTAIYKGNNEWRFDWKLESIPVGTYVVRAHIRRNSGELDTSNPLEVAVARPVTTTTATTTVSPTTESLSPETVSLTPTLKPEIEISFPYEEAVSGFADITVKVAKARFIELYVRPNNALTPRFIGLTRHIRDNEWHLLWDTTKTPNGDYELFARVAHDYGTTDSGEIPLTVRNAYVKAPTPEQEKQISELKETYQAIEPVPVVTTATVPISTAPTVPSLTDKFIELRLDEADLQERLHDLFDEYREELNELSTAYAEAIRHNDATAKQAVETEIATLRASIIDRLELPSERSYALSDLDAYINELTNAALARIERNEAIIRERLAERVLLDTDRDGISDFDEINLYNTNPFQADTDADGISDGLEIQNGYDPLSAKSEALLAYESPKEAGITRDDVLQISMVDTLSEVVAETERPSAVFSGTGLPNSFITLYIFSTPIVVTVRTDENGNWTYIFDKELEDGEHEAFVAMTDNRGAIVAKSNPFAFTKTAQAFTPVDAGAAPAIMATPPEPSFWTSQLLIVIASLSVVALGLVLLLLGLHVEARRPTPQPV